MHDSMIGRILFLLFAVSALRYMWVRLRVVLPARWRVLGGLVFVLLLFFAFAYRIFDFGPNWAGKVTFALGGFWMVALSNWLVACIGMDLLLLLRWIRMQFMDYQALARRRDSRIPFLALVTLVVTMGFWAYGVSHQLDFKVSYHQIQVDKPMIAPTRVAVISDIHFDPLFPVDKWKRLLAALDTLQPQLILIVGDLSDLSSSDLDGLRMGRLIKMLKAPQGVFATSGNHEAYMEQRDPGLMQWFAENGVRWLHDESICLDAICLTGRLDVNYAPHVSPTGVRKPLGEIAPDQVSLATRAWILMDHQPKGLLPQERTAQLPDLGLSGHTHGGQFFPWTIVIRFLWPLAEGLGEIGGVRWITSSGFGQWGPALRVGSDTELLVLDILPQ